MDPAQIKSLFPHLAPRTQAALHARRAGTLDSVGLGRHLLRLACDRGVQLVTGEVVSVEVAGGAVRSVTVLTEAGTTRVETASFMDAAGPFAGSVAGLLGEALPLENVLQQKVLIRDARRVVPRDAPFTIFLDPQELDWSAVDRDRLRRSRRTERLLEPLPAGLHIKPDGDTTGDLVKLGWAYNQEPETPRWEPLCPPEFPRTVLLGGSRIVPGLGTYLRDEHSPVVDHTCGYYVRTPDGLPLVGPLQVAGAHVVAGLAGYGAMAACAAGELAAAWVTGDALPDF
ncbi:MAG: hypothetical protein QOH61_1564, partial [Chloroflexota bacterium]|nr:hypothetical protein [Chloroflexota bacterium]